MIKVERRFLVSSELRAESQGDEMSLVGYASVFNSKSEDLGGFRETVLPGAFARSIRQGADVKALVNHDPSMIVGRTKNGTLKLEEDARGLKFNVKLPPTQVGRDLFQLVKRGDMDQCSFAFTAKDQSWEDERDGNGDLYASRKLMDVDLMDVSMVTYPAYTDTVVNTPNFTAPADGGAGYSLGGRARPAAAELRSIGCPEGLAEKIEQRWPDKSGADDHGKGGGSEGTQAGQKANDKDSHTAASAAHQQMAEDHKAAADAHQSKADGLYAKADEEGEKNPAQAGIHAAQADAHQEAAYAHNAAADAHSSAAGQHDDAAKSPGKGASLAARLSSKGANAASKAAFSSSKGTRDLEAGEKRGTENQPFTLEGIDLPTPADPDLKEKWWKAFQDAYSDFMKKGGQGMEIKQAIGQAIAEANKAVQPQTEVTPEVSGQGKQPTDVPHEEVPTAYGDNPIRSARVKAESDELRIYKSVDEVPDNVPAAKKKQWLEVWNSAYKKAKSDGKAQEDAESSAFAQANAVAGPNSEKNARRDRSDEVSDPDSPDYDPDDPDYDESLDETHGEGRSARYGEDRDGKTKTVSGKALHAGDFAFVGDPNDPSTWKLPVHDEGHAKNALARFNQTQGIPADKKDAVWKRIVAACKKFGVKVSEEDSLRCGQPHSVAQAIMDEVAIDEAAVLEGLRMRQRLIEIDLA